MTVKIVIKINWRLIGYHKTTNEIFNNSLSISVEVSTTYSNFNNYILKIFAPTKATNNKKKKGWLHFSHDYLLPLFEIIDVLLYDYQNLGIGRGE